MSAANSRIPSEEEFNQWLADPVTKVYYQLMRLWKESLKDQWSRGVFQKEDIQATSEANAAALGQIEQLNKLLDLDVIDIEGTFSDAQ